MLKLVFVNFCWFALVSTSYAQSTASISGHVLDPSGAAVASATVTVSNHVNRFSKQIQTLADGSYSFANLPFQSYELTVEKPGFVPTRQTISLRSNIRQTLDLRLALEDARTSINVLEFEKGMLIDPQQTGTRAQMNQSDIERLALQVGNRGLESVLLTFPGFSQNANGAIHPRGAHNQMLFVVDGMPISDQLTGAFANAVDPNMVQTVELYTSNIPAEYGSKVSAVANVTTRAGQGSGRALGGSAMISGARFDTLSTVLQGYGERGKLGYSASVSAMKSNRYLDQVSLENLHNGGNLERGYARLDYHPRDKDQLRFLWMGGRSDFQLANLASQHANQMRQRQQLGDQSGMIGWVHTFSPRTTFDATASLRTSTSSLLPSPGDIPVTAEQFRRLTTFTSWNRINTIRGAHTIKAGFDFQHFPVFEDFRFAVTDSGFNDPDSDGFIPTLLAHDLTRGGRLFQFRKRAAGQMYTGFLQDNVRLGRWQLSLGLRHDDYRFLAKGVQLQPRLGVSYHLKETNTVFRASYNRTFQTPPNENLLLSNSDESSVLVAPNVRETLGGALVLVAPERQNFYEAGLEQALFGRLSLNASYYHKNAVDQQDNNNFFNTGIIFPMSLARIRVNGAEGRLVLPDYRGFSATLSVTHMRAISTPPFTGGLFIGNSAVDILSSGPFVIDHDQKLSLQTVLQYTSPKGFFVTASIRHDSGLVTNPSDPEQVAADPDFAPLLPYVNLTSNPPRTRPRTITDVAAGYARSSEGRRRWELTLQISNLTNKTALYNFQSLFVGTRLAPPRTAGLRFRWFF
jgi:outer membrane cobalamin receptor